MLQAPVVGSGDIDRAALPAPTAALSCGTCTDMPEVSWSPVASADSYQVTIATDPEATSVLRSYSTPFLTLTPRDQLPDASAGSGYWVFVQACTSASGGGLETAGCGVATRMSFKKITPPVTGLGSADVPGGVVLSWNDLAGRYSAALSAPGLPSVEAENYRIQVTHTDDTDFANPVVSQQVDRACDVTSGVTCYQPSSSVAAGKGQFLLDSVKDGDYLWRVTPIDLAGNHLPSSRSTVTVDASGPVFRLTDNDGLPVNGVFHIAASDGSVIQGVSGNSLHVVSVTTGNAVAGTLHDGADSQHWTFDPSGVLVTGEHYALSVSSAITDSHGNFAVVKGGAVRTARLADDRGPAWNYSSGWSRHSSSNAIGGTYSSAGAGKATTVHLRGGSVSVYGCRGPKLGKVKVVLDGTTMKTVDEHRSFTACGVLLWKSSVSAKVHSLTFKTVGTGALDAVRVS
jgi:hypothetical protein